MTDDDRHGGSDGERLWIDYWSAYLLKGPSATAGSKIEGRTW
jgi:hypothetical protein